MWKVLTRKNDQESGNGLKESKKVVSLANNKRVTLLTIFVIATAGLHILTFLQLTVATLWIAKLARKPAPSLVQMLDGKPVQVSAAGALDRTPEAMKRFTSDIMVMLFSARGTLPVDKEATDNKPQKDLGIELKGYALRGRKNLIPTPAWFASFALSEDFRSEFLAALAEMTPAQVFTGGTQTMLLITHLSEPLPVVDQKNQMVLGHHQVNMIAELYVFSPSHPAGRAIPVNKEVLLRAVYPNQNPLPEGATEVEKAVYRIRAAGLEIYRIRDLEVHNSQRR